MYPSFHFTIYFKIIDLIEWKVQWHFQGSYIYLSLIRYYYDLRAELPLTEYITNCQ